MKPAIDPKNVIYADLDETEGVVLNLATTNYYRLNETGQFIWKRITDGLPADEIAREMSLRFAVSEKDALADVQAFLSSAREEALVG